MGKVEVRSQLAWAEGFWSQQTVALLQRWATLLDGLTYELYDRARPRRKKVVEQLERMKQLAALTNAQTVRTSKSFPPTEPSVLWARFREALAHWPTGPFPSTEAIALHLAEEFGWPELALEMIAIHEVLAPDEVGVGRAHLRALTGERGEALLHLRAVVVDETRSWGSRIAALDCLMALDVPSVEPLCAKLERALLCSGAGVELASFQSMLASYGLRSTSEAVSATVH